MSAKRKRASRSNGKVKRTKGGDAPAVTKGNGWPPDKCAGDPRAAAGAIEALQYALEILERHAAVILATGVPSSALAAAVKLAQTTLENM